MEISPAFLTYAAGILAQTQLGVSGSVMIRLTVEYAVRYGVELPHPQSAQTAANKRRALLENLPVFPPEVQHRILLDLCDHNDLTHPERKALKARLLTEYRPLDTEGTVPTVDEVLIEQTSHWLGDFPKAKKLYEEALFKVRHGEFQRNALDDLRSALEQLLKTLLANDKSLENQLPSVGVLLKQSDSCPQLADFLHKLLDYYSSYQNAYAKHNDAVKQEEVDVVLELTSTFLKHLVRIGSKR